MYNNRFSKYRVLSVQKGKIVSDPYVSFTFFGGQYVTKVTNMSLLQNMFSINCKKALSNLSFWSTVVLTKWIKMTSSSLALFSYVSIGMNMKSVQSWHKT